MSQVNREKQIFAVLVLLTALLIVLIIILASVPPISRDALTHHLAVPKLWINNGSIYEIPDLKFSYYPMNLDLLYVIPLYFGNDIIPKYIHFAFALATAWLLFIYLRAKLNQMLAILGALFFLTMPVIVKLSITVYVDLGLIFFTMLSLLYLMRWVEEEFSLRYLIVAAISCGLALGTKYNALLSLFILSAMVPYVYIRWTPEKLKAKATHLQAKALCYGIVFVVIACLVFSPWMIKNIIWTGNPLYPLFNKYIKASPRIEDQKETNDRELSNTVQKKPTNSYQSPLKMDNHFVVRRLVYGEAWWETATIPLRVFFQGKDDIPKYFDGRLNPFLLLFSLIILYRFDRFSTQVNREIKMLCMFSILYLLLVFFLVDMRIRWISPIIPPLVILSMFGISRFWDVCGQIGRTTVNGVCSGLLVLAIILMFLFNFSYILNLYSKVNPVSFLSGQTSRDAYIQRYRSEYAVLQFLNKNIPKNSEILCLFLGNRRYYSDRKMNFNYNIIKPLIEKSGSPSIVVRKLEDRGITHLVIRNDLFNKWARDSFSPAEHQTISLFFLNHTETLFSQDGYTLKKLKPS